MKHGFTLIELLVVIAIIGVLSSIVLASVNSARNKGSDAKTKAQLAGLRGAAEYYYNSNNFSFSNASDCASGMFADANSKMTAYTNLASYPAGMVLVCQANNVAYAVQANLASGGYWCVDSVGISKPESAPLGGSTYNCI